MAWNPIDTAPLGTDLLLTDGDVCHVGHIYHGPDGTRHVWNVAWDHHGIGDGFHPTHWMALPGLPNP